MKLGRYKIVQHNVGEFRVNDKSWNDNIQDDNDHGPDYCTFMEQLNLGHMKFGRSRIVE